MAKTNKPKKKAVPKKPVQPDAKDAQFVGMSLMKFEELGVLVHGVPVDICPSNMIGFLPVFESREQAEEAGWSGDKVIGIQSKSIED